MRMKRPSKRAILEGFGQNAFLDAWWKLYPKNYARYHRKAGGKGSLMITNLLNVAQDNDTANIRVYEIREKALGN